MSNSWITSLKGAATLVLFTLNVVAWFIPIMAVAIVKLIVPIQALRDRIERWLMAFGEHWISFNGGILALTQSVHWDIRGVENLRRREWYLVLSNHQSWVDVMVLQAALNRRIPFLKFFIKQQLIWVPFLGVVWWAMDMPFMRRYSREYLAKHPEMRGRDLEETRKACEKFANTPTSIINFVEGTRFTPEKQAETGRIYRNLLPPRAGGTAFVLSAMAGSMHSLLDVTIVYGTGGNSMWDLCCGRLERITVVVREREIEQWVVEGDYTNDPAFREKFQQWLSDMWSEKDSQIDALRA